MANIEFKVNIPFTSSFPPTMINGVANTYVGIFPGEQSETGEDTRSSIGIGGVRCTPPPFPPSITFENVTSYDTFVWSRLNSASIGAVLNVATFEIGTDGTTHIYFVVDIKCREKDTSYVHYDLKYYIRKVQPGTPPNVIITEDIIRDWSSMGIIFDSSGTVLDTRYAFGFNFILLPGRENKPENYCLWFAFTNATKSNGTRNFTPYQNPLGTTIMAYNMLSYNSGSVYSGVVIDFQALFDSYGVKPTAKVFSPEAGEESVQGGMNEPAFDDRSDTIGIPTAPSQNITGLGFFNVYRMQLSSLNDLHDYLFGSEITSQSTTEDILKAIGNNMFHAKLTDYIVSCHLIPVDPTPNAIGVTTVHLGNVTAENVTGVACDTDYIDVDCGSINLPEYYENFADFLESCRLFLPFIGFVPAQPEWFKNTTLSVSYRFNIIDGSCVAFVTSSGKYTNNGNSGGTIVAQYSGTACIRYPITGLSYASMATGVIGATAGMLAAGGAGSLLGVAGSAVNMAQAKPTVAQSNGYNSCSAMMGVRRPYLYIERPVSSYARNYQHELGIPANIYTDSLGSVSGFVKMENVHVDGIPGATDYEKEEIKRLLAQGVIV